MFEIEAKKSLGQNFLKNPSIIDKIVSAGDIKNGDLIVEIGPGTGAMTGVILDYIQKSHKAGHGVSSGEVSLGRDSGAKKEKEIKKPGKLIVIEKDRRAIPVLEAKFKDFIEKGLLQIIEGDFLEIDIAQIVNKPHKTYKIIANIPYYITGAILRKALGEKIKPEMAIFLVQKEVAERIVRREGKTKNWGKKSNILAESISAYGKAEYLFTVAKGNFVPIPRVDSAAIRIVDISSDRFHKSDVSEELFFEVMKAGFSHKRKKLASNLKDYVVENMKKIGKKVGKLGHSDFLSKKLSEIFAKNNIDPDSRAEEMTTDKWFEIAKEIKEISV